MDYQLITNMRNTGKQNFYFFGSEFSKLPISIRNELTFEEASQIIKGNYSKIDLPLTFKKSSGQVWTDVLNPGSVSMYIVSQRFIFLLQENKISGWKAYPIRILDKSSVETNEYFGLSILGKSGQIDYSKSHLIERRIVPNGPITKYYQGACIDLDSWDGSDFFIPENSLQIVVTRKVVDLIEKNAITNVKLENLSDIQTPEFAVLKKDQP